MNNIDILSLINDVSPQAPSGEKDLQGHPRYIELEIKTKGTPRREFDKDPDQAAKGPNWAEIQEIAMQLLSRCHDLRVAMILTRALLHTDGITGLGSGLALIQGLVDHYWDSFYPRLDPEDNNDPTERINILASLSEGDDILGPLKKRGLCASPQWGNYCFRDYLIAAGRIESAKEDGSPPPNMMDIEAAFKDSDKKKLRSKKTAIDRALSHLIELRQNLEDKLGDNYAAAGADFKALHELLTEMGALMDKQFADRTDSESTSSETADPIPGTGVAQPPSEASAHPFNPSGAIRGRADVIRMLDQICLYYRSNEPGSPVPMLLQRARQLVEKNFMEIIEDLAPDSAGKIKNLLSGAEMES